MYRTILFQESRRLFVEESSSDETAVIVVNLYSQCTVILQFSLDDPLMPGRVIPAILPDKASVGSSIYYVHAVRVIVELYRSGVV